MNSYYVSADNSHFSSLDGVLFNKDKTSLLEFPRGRDGEYVIPDSVESIEIRSFTGCSLSSVTIADAVTYIGLLAFANCKNITSVTIPGSVTHIGWIAFNGCSDLTSLYFMGEPPTLELSMFWDIPSELVIYYAEGTPGWGATFSGTPTAPFTPWGKYVPIKSELGTHTDTSNWLGILEITHDPWVWCERGNCWFNIPDQTASAGSGWVYPSDQDTLLIMPIAGTDWGYSFALNKWLYLTEHGWVYMM